jgi:tetratricopeptide (TPR) repeat protein/CHAT domain-containing protein
MNVTNNIVKKYSDFVFSITIALILCFSSREVHAQIDSYNLLNTEYNRLSTLQKFDSALILARRINIWARQNKGDTSFAYAISFRIIGDQFMSLRKNDSAIYYYNFSLISLKNQNRINHSSYALCLERLGNLYYNSGNYNSAEPYYKQALEIRKKVLSEKHPDYASNLNSLGNLYYNCGNYNSAENYFKQALEIRKIVLGEMHQDYAWSLYNLGRVYNKIGDYESAEPYYKQALEIRKKVLGEKHPDYASSLNTLGGLYGEMGDYKSAEPYYKQALEIRKKVLGVNHQNYASSLNNLGVLYEKMGDYKSAEHYYKQALEIRKKVLGEKHPDYALSLNNLGGVYEHMGDYKSSEYYLKMALEIRKKVLGEKHPDYASSLNFLGLLYKNLGDYNSSLSSFKASLEIRKEVLGEYHKDFAISLNNVAGAYKLMGNYKLAESYYKHSLSIIAKVQGETHPNYATSCHNLCKLYIAMADYTLAEKYLKRSLEIRKEKLGVQHPYYGTLLNDLGYLNELKGDYKSAELYYKEALEIRKKGLGEEHPDYLSSLNNLAILYSKTNRSKDALLIYEANIEVLNKNITLNFEWLNDNEKELFWKMSEYFYNTLDQFVTSHLNELPQATNLSYNSILFTKGKLMEAKISKENDLLEIVEIRDKLSFIRKKLAKLNENGDAIQFKKLADDANVLDSKLSQIWDEYANQKKNLSITWNQVQATLSSDESAIEFVRYKAEKDSQYYYNALIIRKNDVNPILVPLCKEDQLKSINTKEGFSDFYPLIWAPMEIYLKDIKTIYYSPVGLLNNIPFGAIYPKKGAGDIVKVTFAKRGVGMESSIVSEENADFLMKKYTLHQLTSTRYLAMGLKEKSVNKIEKSIVLIGGVNYNYLPGVNEIGVKKEIKTASRVANSAKLLKYLAGTKIEVDNISKCLQINGWETSVLEYDSATEENVVKFENKDAKGVLHIATHGFAFPNIKEFPANSDSNILKQGYCYYTNPLQRCGLLLAGANWAWTGSDELKKRNLDAEDGVLTAAQVALLNLRKTNLVVLSACETGLGKIIGNEGVFGLKRAFKLAGVEQMVVSLWEVPDKESMELMSYFYNELAETQNSIVSFEKAQKTMLNKYPTRPDLWAGFVLVR